MLRVQAARGFKIPHLESEPRLCRTDTVKLAAFSTLSRSRPSGFEGQSRIPLRDIVLWLDFKGIVGQDAREELATGIMAIDDFYFRIGEQKAATESKDVE